MKTKIVIVGLTTHDEAQVHRDLKLIRPHADLIYERPLGVYTGTEADWVVVLSTFIDSAQVVSSSTRYGRERVHVVKSVDAVVRMVCRLASPTPRNGWYLWTGVGNDRKANGERPSVGKDWCVLVWHDGGEMYASSACWVAPLNLSDMGGAWGSQILPHTLR